MNEKEEKNQVKSPELARADAFDQAIASRNKIIEGKDVTISGLEKKISDREQTISRLIEERDNEKTARIEAENQVSSSKELKIEHKGSYFKTEEEKFNDSFLNEWDKLNK